MRAIMKFAKTVFALLLLLNFNQLSHANQENQIFHISLDQDGKITLDWALDFTKETIWFEIHLPREDFGWFAFGFSDYGDLFPADYYLLWTDWKNSVALQDARADEKGVLHLDKQQDSLGYHMKQRGDILKFTFHRKFDTCDANDYVIQDGTTHIVWSKGPDVVHHLRGLNISTRNSGMVRTQLLKNLNVSIAPPNSETFEMRVDKVNVPNTDTTYWCKVVKLPEKFQTKHHILQYEPVIEEKNQGFVHHMEVFHCIVPVGEVIPEYAGSCFASERPQSTQVCKRVLAAWAMGAKGFAYPEEAALPLGGPDFNPYIMLEVHYNNPQRHSGLVDSSGIRFYVTPKLREMDAGVIELGLEYTDKMAIPPKQESFSLSGYCVTECTSISVPPTGITIFGSQLHTHLTGIRVRTRHFRNGIELPEVNRDDHYSTHFQEIRKLRRPVTVLPGDALVTTCDYKTMTRNNITLGGFAISDEMCVNYIHYFPAIDLEVCKSSISDDALKTYFQYMNEWENQDISAVNGISASYAAIEWNKMRVELLKDVYYESPLSMQCNMSSGDRFPGYWENTPRTTILKPLPPPKRSCFNENKLN